MTNIVVNQVSDYTRIHDANKESQKKLSYKDLVLYARVKNLDDLAHCNGISNIEEWMLNVNDPDKSGVMLIILAENDLNYSLLSSVTTDIGVTPTVVETPLSKDAFLQLKTIGVQGYFYRRHRFDIPYSKNAFLVDVFKNITGNDHEWVRITLSNLSDDDEIPKLPFKVVEHVYENDPEHTQTEKQTLENLWQRQWLSIEKA